MSGNTAVKSADRFSNLQTLYTYLHEGYSHNKKISLDLRSVFENDEILTFYNSFLKAQDGKLEIDPVQLDPETLPENLTKIVLSGSTTSFDGDPQPRDISITFTENEGYFNSEVKISIAQLNIGKIEWLRFPGPSTYIVTEEPLKPLSVFMGGNIPKLGIELRLKVPIVMNRMLFQGYPQEPYPSISEFLTLIGVPNIAETLPAPLNTLVDLGLYYFETSIDAENFTVDYIHFGIKSETPWEIIPGTLSFTGIEIDTTVYDIGENPSIRNRILVTLELRTVQFMLSAAQPYYENSGWVFQGKTGPGQEIPIGMLITDLAEKFKTDANIPAAIDSLVFRNLAVSFNTGNKNFEFSGEASLEVDDKQFDITVTVTLTRQDDGEYKKEFSGALTFGGAEFTLDFKSTSEMEKALTATWNSGDSGQLDLKAISDDLPDLSDLETLLMPTSATLTLNLSDGKKSLLLDCTIGKGAKAAFLLTQDSGATPPRWIAALGLKPGKISTESLGPLGSALRPHNIALDKLVILAASADAPEESRLTLDEQEYPVTKGLLLQGALEFEATSFSYPFECRLGGGEQPKALPAGDAGKTRPAALVPTVASMGESPAAEEGKNNVTVGRTIGPVTFRKARLESRNKCVYVLLDASLGSGGFALDLDGFNINFPLEVFKDPSNLSGIGVGLDGLSISYSKPPLTISGGFARTEIVPPPYVDDLYQGHLLIKAATFQVTLLGSYGTIDINGEKKPSLFLFGTYAGVVGGPPAFFVTGLALGGGYNTRLALPPIEEVAEFPLVQAVTAPEKFTNDALMKAVQPSYGDYWLAVGVKFTSFKMADSFALFSVAFGNRLQFALLGLTKLAMPPGAEKDKCAVYAELAIRAVLDPEAGVFSIEGRLTQNSYVLAKEFHLTGGFAFFVWFGNAAEAGDFVISLGGYHPAFLPPPHYPVVPRVGIRGQIGALTVTGEAYLALTPSCLMAGQKLEAVFQSGKITAAFVAFADFIIAWAPFHYDARIGIGIAVAYQSFRTFKLEVNASLHIWGPPFAGTAHVSLRIVSFTVEFGDTRGAQPNPLTWNEFQQAFLPASDTTEESGPLSTIRITEGLVREVKKQVDGKEEIYRIVNPHELMIETDSAVPCSKIQVGKEEQIYTQNIGIRPMEVTNLTSLHAVSIKDEGQSPVETQFNPVQWSQKNYPEALWSPSKPSGKPEAGMIKDVPSGVVLRVQPKTPEHLGPFLIEKFAYELILKNIPWLSAPSEPKEITEQFSKVEEVNQLRSDIRACLVKRVKKPEESPWNEIVMKNTADNPSERFQAPPSCAALGQSIGGLA